MTFSRVLYICNVSKGSHDMYMFTHVNFDMSHDKNMSCRTTITKVPIAVVKDLATLSKLGVAAELYSH